MKPTLSIIAPVYNEQESLTRFVAETTGCFSNADIPFELLLIDDGSQDQSWELISGFARQDFRCKGIRLSRNFGKEAAIFAGLEAAEGACCLVMDSDLQHPPATGVEMFCLWQKGLQVVEAKKLTRGKENPLRRLAAKGFYRLLEGASGLSLQNASDFMLLDRQVIDTLLCLKERSTFFRGLSRWVGFSSGQVWFEVPKRAQGRSKWSLSRLFSYAFGAIASFSSLPMQLVTLCGAVFFLFSLVLGANTLYNKLSGQSAEGFPTVILLLLIIGSIIMLSLGIIGYYIAKIYEEIKGRPRYVLSQKTPKPAGQEEERKE